MSIEIISISFVSKKCYYCDNPWKHRLEVETIDSEGEVLTGETVNIYVCQSCRDTRLTAFEDRVTVTYMKPDMELEADG